MFYLSFFLQPVGKDRCKEWQFVKFFANSLLILLAKSSSDLLNLKGCVSSAAVYICKQKSDIILLK